MKKEDRILKAVSELQPGQSIRARELSKQLDIRDRTIGWVLSRSDLVQYKPGYIGEWVRV